MMAALASGAADVVVEVDGGGRRLLVSSKGDLMDLRPKSARSAGSEVEVVTAREAERERQYDKIL